MQQRILPLKSTKQFKKALEKIKLNTIDTTWFKKQQ